MYLSCRLLGLKLKLKVNRFSWLQNLFMCNNNFCLIVFHPIRNNNVRVLKELANN